MRRSVLVAGAVELLAPAAPATAAQAYQFRIRAAAVQPQISDLVMGRRPQRGRTGRPGPWAGCGAVAAGFDEGGLTSDPLQELTAPRYNVHNPLRAVHRMPRSDWDAPAELQRVDSDERVAPPCPRGARPSADRHCARTAGAARRRRMRRTWRAHRAPAAR